MDEVEHCGVLRTIDPVLGEQVNLSKQEKIPLGNLWTLDSHRWCDDHRVIDNDVSEEDSDGNDDDYDKGNLVDISEGNDGYESNADDDDYDVDSQLPSLISLFIFV